MFSLNSANLSLKGLKSATLCARDQGATTMPARHMWETLSLNWSLFYPWVMYLLTIRITEAFGVPKLSLFCNVPRDVAFLPSYSKLNSKCDI